MPTQHRNPLAAPPRRGRQPTPPLARQVAARLIGRRCPTPPHRAHRQAGRPAADVAGGLRGLVRWVRTRPAERVPLPIGAGVWGAGGVAYLADLPAYGIAPVTAGAVLAAYGAVAARTKDPQRASKTAVGVGAGGSWVATAAELGMTAGPYGALSWGYWALFGLGYAVYRADDATRSAIADREQKTAWHRLAPALGLGGSHLLSREETRLGETLVVDVSGTGRRASALASGDLAERIAEHERIPPGRVQVTADRIAGRLRISIRRTDPWAKPSPHPLLDDHPEIELPTTGDATKPLVVGADPETGAPLQLTVWDSDGAANVVVVAIKGGGKTVLVNNTLERLTAAPNAAVWGIDAGKGKDIRRWRDAGALDLAACGRTDRGKAVNMLRLADKAIECRAATNTEAVFTPRPGRPLITVVVDEVDKLVGPGDQLAQAAAHYLTNITSKGRSEGVGVVLCGQRGTAAWMGGADIRANIDRFALLKVNRRNEMAHVAGDLGLELPDMTRYGEGHAGVTLIGSADGDYTAGRTFKLDDLGDVETIASDGRAPSPLEPGLVEQLGDAYQKLKAPAGDTASTPATAAPGGGSDRWLDGLDREMEDAMPDDLRQASERMRDAAAKRNSAREYLESLPDTPAPDADTTRRLRESAQARNDQAAEQTDIPPKMRDQLADLLRDGIRVGEVTAELGVHRSTAWRYLNRLRWEGRAAPRGRGRGAAWYLTEGHGQ